MKTAVTLNPGKPVKEHAARSMPEHAPAVRPLDLFRFFDGDTCAWGLFEDRLGRVRRQFQVDIDGRTVSDRLILDERFLFDDGERSRRVWTIRRHGDQAYIGQADDLVGLAHGRAAANAVNWRYRMRLAVGQRTWQVDFDDRMLLQSGGVLLSRARIRKFGFEIGSVTISFAKS